ncbi:dihydroorotate dehydrogenase [[Eubacterium] cellulosolvens]
MTVDLSINLAGLVYSNPVQAASGILGVSSSLMVRAYRSGAGCVVTKSIGLRPREGFCGPNIVAGDDYLINAMGLPNPGIEESLKEVAEAMAAGVRIIGSIYGFSEQEYAQAAKRLSDAGVEAVELNISCPTVSGTGTEIGQDPELVRKIVAAVRSGIDKPLIVKLTPNITDIVAIGRAAVDAGADALTAINTIKGMAIDSEVMRPVLSSGFGGVSGPAIKPIALRCIYDLYRNLKVPIVGCGGITNEGDAIEFFLAGASAIQVGTGILYRDLRIFKNINNGLRRYLLRKRLKDLSSLIGKAHQG